MKGSTFANVFLTAILVSVFQVEAVTLAALNPAGTQVLIVDGNLHTDITETTDIENSIPGFTFGQVGGRVFSPLIANTTAISVWLF